VGVAVVLVAACGNRTDTSASDGGAPPANAGTSAGTPAAGATFGTVANPCGPAAAGQTRSAGDVGITADRITISVISDPGGARPGLNQSVFDSMNAFTAYCNGLGGINGRTIVLVERDAKLTQYKDRMIEACQDSFAVVGSVGVLDDTGVADAEACDMVNVPATAIGSVAGADPRTFQPMPLGSNVSMNGNAKWIKANYPGVVDAAGTTYSNLPVLDYQNRRRVATFEQTGFTYKDRRASNINETSWGPILVGMKNNGVKYFNITSSYEEILPLLKEMNAQDWKPDLIELDGNYYDPTFPVQLEAQGIDPGNTLVTMVTWPFEEADQNPATKTYLDELEKAVPGASPTTFGQLSFSAAMLWATATKAAGANPTRDSLMAELTKITAWSGGGMHGPTNPTAHVPTHCFMMVKVSPDGFSRVYPLADKDKAIYQNGTLAGMDCNPDNQITLTDPPQP
jgi:ABC-type branched-subunit amino acid transport system substrate-binding protein